MDINLLGKLFTINVGRVTVEVAVPEIQLNKTGLTIHVITWIGCYDSPVYNHRYFSFHILGFGIGVQVRKKEESNA